jgi:hypothetical protein
MEIQELNLYSNTKNSEIRVIRAKNETQRTYSENHRMCVQVKGQKVKAESQGKETDEICV